MDPLVHSLTAQGEPSPVGRLFVLFQLDNMNTNPASISAKRPRLGEFGYVEYQLAEWSQHGFTLPLDMKVVEFFGSGDQAFGGAADDRPLGPDNIILDSRAQLVQSAIVFETLEEAQAAALKITNRRENSLLGILPRWR